MGASRPPFELVAVYRAHVQRVARWASRLGGPVLDAEDVVQEVFLKVQRLLPSFRGDAEVTTWLYRITENVVRHRRRSERFRWFIGRGQAELLELPADASSPLELLESEEANRLVYRVLDRMSEKHRRVVIFMDLEGLSAEELAALTGVKAATLRVRLHRARAEFAKRLDKLRRTDRVGGL